MRSLLATMLLLLAACSSEDGAPAAALDPFGANFVESAIADADDAGLDDDEARCIATSILDGIDQDRLVELGVAADGTAGTGFIAGSDDLTPDEQRTVATGFEDCLDDAFEWLLPVRNDEDECFIDSIRASGVTFEQLLFSEANEEAVGQALVDAADECFDS